MNAAPDSCCSSDPRSGAEDGIRCPLCGEAGQRIATLTLKHIVEPEFLEAVTKPGFQFCRAATCDVVYFHPEGFCLHKADVRVRVGLKETEDPIPLCYCFGFTEAMVGEEIRATGRCTIPQRITAEVKAGNCACKIRNPQGSCCLGNITAAVKRAIVENRVIEQQSKTSNETRPPQAEPPDDSRILRQSPAIADAVAKYA
jgi:hypothetical protein